MEPEHPEAAEFLQLIARRQAQTRETAAAQALVDDLRARRAELERRAQTSPHAALDAAARRARLREWRDVRQRVDKRGGEAALPGLLADLARKQAELMDQIADRWGMAGYLIERYEAGAAAPLRRTHAAINHAIAPPTHPTPPAP